MDEAVGVSALILIASVKGLPRILSSICSLGLGKKLLVELLKIHALTTSCKILLIVEVLC